MRFQILIFDGFDELDAIAPFEILHNAGLLQTGATVELVVADEPKEIVAAHGLRIHPSGRLNLQQPPDVLIVPGGGWIGNAPKGARAEAARGVIPAAVKSLHQSGTIISAVCTGAMLLAASGILQGRPAVTHHGAIQDLQATGAQVVQARVVDGGDIITAGGVTSGLDLALWLVERFFGSKIGHEVEREIEYERRGIVWQEKETAWTKG